MLTNLQTFPEREELVSADSPDEEPLYAYEELASEEKENLILLYLRDVARYPLLTPEEEAELAREIMECRENLIRLLLKIPIPLREIDQLKRRIRTDGQVMKKSHKYNADLIERLLLRLREIDAEVATDKRMNGLLDQIHQLESKLRDASNRMVQSNLRLVVHISKNFNNGRISLIDLIQEGNLGLIKAVARFDPNRRLRFSTYARWWIWQAILKAIDEKGPTIRMPAHMLEALNRYWRVMGSKEESGDLPPEQIREKARLSRIQWEALWSPIKEPVSLETPKGDEQGRLIDTVPDHRSQSPSETVMQKELSQELRKSLKALSPREETVIRQRFGIDYGRDYTLEEIGRQMGLCRESIRQIEKMALEKLKKGKRGKVLKNFNAVCE